MTIDGTTTNVAEGATSCADTMSSHMVSYLAGAASIDDNRSAGPRRIPAMSRRFDAKTRP